MPARAPLNLPNAVTVARIAVVPLVAQAMLRAHERGGSPPLAAALFNAVALTDALDGYLARSRRCETDFGRVVDPLADKALIAAALSVLVHQRRMTARAAVAIVAREAAVTALRAFVGRRGVVVPASRLGKRKTTLQFAAITALILTPDPRAAWTRALVHAAVLLTFASGVEYFAKAVASESAGHGESA